jgi:hypothetical protein
VSVSTDEQPTTSSETSEPAAVALGVLHAYAMDAPDAQDAAGMEYVLAAVEAIRCALAERDNWEADALLRAQNTAYWQGRAEKAEAELAEIGEMTGRLSDETTIESVRDVVQEWEHYSKEMNRAGYETIPRLQAEVERLTAEREEWHVRFSDVLREHSDFMNAMLAATDLTVDEDGEYILDQIVTAARAARTERDALAIENQELRAAFIKHRTATHEVKPNVCVTCQESDAVLARTPMTLTYLARGIQRAEPLAPEAGERGTELLAAAERLYGTVHEYLVAELRMKSLPEPRAGEPTPADYRAAVKRFWTARDALITEHDADIWRVLAPEAGGGAAGEGA